MGMKAGLAAAAFLGVAGTVSGVQAQEPEFDPRYEDQCLGVGGQYDGDRRYRTEPSIMRGSPHLDMLADYGVTMQFVNSRGGGYPILVRSNAPSNDPGDLTRAANQFSFGQADKSISTGLSVQIHDELSQKYGRLDPYLDAAARNSYLIGSADRDRLRLLQERGQRMNMNAAQFYQAYDELVTAETLQYKRDRDFGIQRDCEVDIRRPRDYNRGRDYYGEQRIDRYNGRVELPGRTRDLPERRSPN